jgi:hypothetical protein
MNKNTNKLLHPTHTAPRFCAFAALHFMHKKRSAACAAEQGVKSQENI